MYKNDVGKGGWMGFELTRGMGGRGFYFPFKKKYIEKLKNISSLLHRGILYFEKNLLWSVCEGKKKKKRSAVLLLLEPAQVASVKLQELAFYM